VIANLSFSSERASNFASNVVDADGEYEGLGEYSDETLAAGGELATTVTACGCGGGGGKAKRGSEASHGVSGVSLEKLFRRVVSLGTGASSYRDPTRFPNHDHCCLLLLFLTKLARNSLVGLQETRLPS
jgi:hypothetical protein